MQLIAQCRQGQGLCSALAALALAACPGPKGDARCNVQSCELLVACQVRLDGQADTSCDGLAAGTGYDAYDAGIAYCVAACDADGTGPELACVAANFTTSSCGGILLDGGSPGRAIEAACPFPDAGPCDAACKGCQTQCVATDFTCNLGCVDGGFGASVCYGCNYGCNQALVACQTKCLAQ